MDEFYRCYPSKYYCLNEYDTAVSDVKLVFFRTIKSYVPHRAPVAPYSILLLNLKSAELNIV